VAKGNRPKEATKGVFKWQARTSRRPSKWSGNNELCTRVRASSINTLLAVMQRIASRIKVDCIPSFSVYGLLCCTWNFSVCENPHEVFHFSES
jgi:hypothetical protein